MVHGFEQWCERESGEAVNATSISIPVMDVVVLSTYNGMRAKMRVPFSRANLLKRDNYTCQYCGKKRQTKDLNIDHVVPRARGGITSWLNCVTSCFRCNTRKDDKLLKEAGMELLNKPFAPTWSFCAFNSVTNPKWEKFLSNEKAKTNDELVIS